ncbi:hypothetical protein [Actinomadura alba]|uniref:Exo-alpha-sialidase n=1 Tax=Actinomadura alba TaxID=406431 RepID=A0ABR7LJZ4_9ACTN|nr:hypothetical protein [Actinomadura alba]MBC6464802.1 hypothetical protein [Actinomadura alba]
MNGAGKPENNDPNQPPPEDDQWDQVPAPPPAWGGSQATEATGQDEPAPGRPADPAGPMPGLPAAPPWQYGPPNEFGDPWAAPPALPPDAFASSGPQQQSPAQPAVPPPDAGVAAQPEAFAQPVPPPAYGDPAAPPPHSDPAVPSAYGGPAAPPAYNDPAAPAAYNDPAAPPAYGDPTPRSEAFGGAVPPPPSMTLRSSPEAAGGPSGHLERFQQHGAPAGQPFAPNVPRGDEPWVVQGSRRRRFPTIPVLVVVSVLIVAAGGFGLFTLLTGEDKPTADKSEAKIADTSFTAGQNAQSDGTKQSIRDVAAVGGTFVAVGGEDGGAIPRPRFLVSSDSGRTWRVAQIKTEDGSAPSGSAPNAVVGAEGAWVALGGEGNFRVAWTSTNGMDWVQVGGQISAFRAGDEIEQIARTTRGFVAVGEQANGGAARPVVWISPDGRSWQRLDGGKLKLPTDSGSASRLRYVAASSDVVMIAGDIVKGDGVLAGLWRSTDGGRTWRNVESPNGSGAFGAVHLSSGTSGFLALREGKSGEDRFGVTFRSTDGAAWQPAGRIITSSGESAEFLHLAGGGQGFALLMKLQGDRTVLHRSGDGTTWQLAADLGVDSKRNTNGVAVANGAIAVGGTRLGPDQDFYLSVVDGSGRAAEVDMSKVPDAVNADRTVRDVATADGLTVAVGSANGTAAAWTSADGTTWNRADTSALGGSDVSSVLTKVTHGTRGWLAIGWSGVKPFTAVSTDGRAWQRVDGSVFTPARGRTLNLNAVAFGPAGYVIVGSDIASEARSSAIVLTSSDLRNWRSADRRDLEFKGGAWRRLLGVTATSSGYVAVGTSADPGRDPSDQSMPGIWTSTDGMRWSAQRMSLPDGAASGYLTHVAAKGGTVTALGVAKFADGRRLFTGGSNDAGVTWRATAIPAPTTGPGSSNDVTSLVMTPKGFTAVGTTGRPREKDVVLWTSANGTSWQFSGSLGTALSGPGIQEIRGITVSGGRLLGVGVTTDHRAEHVVLWRRPLG